MKEEDYLCLKWGTIKGINFHSKEGKKLIKEYNKIGACASRMLQEDTPRQKEIILELIEIGNFDKVFLDWDNKWVSKEKAKKHVLNYGNGNKK